LFFVFLFFFRKLENFESKKETFHHLVFKKNGPPLPTKFSFFHQKRFQRKKILPPHTNCELEGGADLFTRTAKKRRKRFFLARPSGFTFHTGEEIKKEISGKKKDFFFFFTRLYFLFFVC